MTVYFQNEINSTNNLYGRNAVLFNIKVKEAKGFISGPSARRTKDLLKLNRDQLRWVVGLLTGH
jgi:hypothetical protein